MPIFIAPMAGALSDRIGGRPLMATGLTLQAVGLAWLGSVMTPTVSYATLVPGLVVSGIGMSLFFAPVANVVLSAVRPSEEGQASGASNAIREAGGVFGVAVLAAVFSRCGGYESGQSFVDRAVAGGPRRRRRRPRRRAGRASDPPPPPSPQSARGRTSRRGHLALCLFGLLGAARGSASRSDGDARRMTTGRKPEAMGPHRPRPERELTCANRLESRA
jgi:MFS family permease